MENLTQLAELLERAARALREADRKLQEIPTLETPILAKDVFSIRVRELLKAHGIYDLSQVCCRTSEWLEKTAKLGVTGMREVHAALEKHGMCLVQTP